MLLKAHDSFPDVLIRLPHQLSDRMRFPELPVSLPDDWAEVEHLEQGMRLFRFALLAGADIVPLLLKQFEDANHPFFERIICWVMHQAFSCSPVAQVRIPVARNSYGGD